MLIFIDGFGIYRNVRRLVMGMYQSPTGLLYNNNGKCIRNTNIFLIVLGPYVTNFDAVVNAIGYFILFEKGVMIEIYGKLIIVLVFIMCYTRDML